MGYERTVKVAAAALLAAAGLGLLGPTAAALVADGLPRAREAAAAWLTPPYLYLVINAIIISIAASSRFQPSTGSRSSASYSAAAAAATDTEFELEPVVVEPPAPLQMPAPVVAVPVAAVRAAEDVAVKEPVVMVDSTDAAPATAPEPEEEEFSISRSAWTPQRRAAEYVENEVAPFADLTNSREKPLVSARFSRKAAKPSPEGSRVLRVARPRREETLESTWKAITEGRAPPLARHLKKSDTWETRPGRRPSGSGEIDAAAAPSAMRKAETFNDGRTKAPAPAAAMRKAETFNDGRSKAPAPAPVRREPSLGQDELNRRVEAFINKFNMEMRLQRQESLKHYNNMLGRGSQY